jgi:hypothetical protein
LSLVSKLEYYLIVFRVTKVTILTTVTNDYLSKDSVQLVDHLNHPDNQTSDADWHAEYGLGRVARLMEKSTILKHSSQT